ncbi:MAG: hypothetical protein LKK19_02765 [Bacteroidales bacterium]|nr:hypothetical protein [Bacteroidales bacterium]MCI2121607.1 hypothetical protein [Bacteroidales bacterium]MCI2144714.1 hypothetical protein [Bacteroidales bacterium]
MKKKIFVILIAAALTLSLSGCSKKCHCVSKINDDVVVDEVIDKDEDKNCSDYNYSVTVLGQSTEVKCNPKVF